MVVCIFLLLLPSLFIELGRPKDLVKASLILFVGSTLVLEKNSFSQFSVAIIVLNTSLIGFFLVEIFSFRWNQLSDDERKKLKTFSRIKENIIKLMEAIKLGFTKIINPLKDNILSKETSETTKKKWVRSSQTDAILNSKSTSQDSSDMEVNSTNSDSKVTINREEDLNEVSQFDNN